MVGMYWGESEAKRDYDSGILRWYQLDDASDIPKEKSDRQTMTVDLTLTPAYLHPPFLRFVESYNETIDKLVAEENPPSLRKRRKR